MTGRSLALVPLRFYKRFIFGQMLYRINTLLGQPVVGAIEFIIDPEKLCR